MAIQVTCSGCKKRFEVSEKFAGQKGPCPNPDCKAIILIPAATEAVVVHAPEEGGPKGVSGRPIGKPIARKEIRFSPLVAIGIGAGALGILGAAVALRLSDTETPPILLVLGALLLAPALTVAGYSVLRDAELEPFRGKELLLRVLPCAVVFPLLWILYFFVPGYLDVNELSFFHLIFIIPPALIIGAFASHCALDLDYGSSAMHYGLYLVVTVSLCLVMKVPLLEFGDGDAATPPAAPTVKRRLQTSAYEQAVPEQTEGTAPQAPSK